MHTSHATQGLPENIEDIHTSVMLRRLIDGVTAETFTLDWLVNHLPKHSFGVIILFLALVSLLPVISVVSRVLIVILALQIILGYHCPVFPRRLMTRPLPSRYLIRLDNHAVPVLERLEKVVRPHWPALLIGTRRLTAFIAMILIILSLLAPIPMANVPAAVVSALLALAYIEHDGLLLLLTLISAITLLIFIPLVLI